MAKTCFYFDTRRSCHDGGHPIKLRFTHNGKAAMVNTGINLQTNQWRNGRVVNRPDAKQLNVKLHSIIDGADDFLDRLAIEGKLPTMSAMEVKTAYIYYTDPDVRKAQLRKELEAKRATLFESRFISFTEGKTGRTKEIYQSTLNRLRDFCPKLSSLSFEDVNRDWLKKFDIFLQEAGARKLNARAIHFRNIRAVFNDAIDDEITSAYPFRRFKIRKETTMKRSLTIEQLRSFMTVKVEPWQEKYRDAFMLIFCLCGINSVDLCHIKQIEGDRINYRRAKTHRPYSIKVEPEALRLIEALKGKDWLIYPLDNYKDYRGYTLKLNAALKQIASKIPGCPPITTYWARHTWATVASYLDIPKEVIAAALGHSGNTVTDIYIRFDERKIDRANRKILDFISGKDAEIF